MATKYTKERLQTAVHKSVSYAGVMRQLGIKKWSGGTQNFIVDKIRFYGINTQHFTGQGSNRGPNHKGGGRKLPWKEVLIKNRVGRRENLEKLRRAMLEAGIPYTCAKCPQGP